MWGGPMSSRRILNLLCTASLLIVMFSVQALAWGSKSKKEHDSDKKEKHSDHSLLKKKDYDDIKRRDRERDAKTPAKPQEKESVVRRYTQRKKDLQRDIKPGEHFTAPVKPGRPPGPETAQKRYGLEKPPKWVGTIRVDKGQPVKKNKTTGGEPGYGEGTSTKKIPQDNVVKINPMR